MSKPVLRAQIQALHCGKQIGSYVGLIPSEDSSSGHQWLKSYYYEQWIRLLDAGEKLWAFLEIFGRAGD